MHLCSVTLVWRGLRLQEGLGLKTHWQPLALFSRTEPSLPCDSETRRSSGVRVVRAHISWMDSQGSRAHRL